MGLDFFEAEENPQQDIAANVTKKPTKVTDLYNTTSCIEPPFTCPHKRIQFYLYTRQAIAIIPLLPYYCSLLVILKYKMHPRSFMLAT